MACGLGLVPDGRPGRRLAAGRCGVTAVVYFEYHLSPRLGGPPGYLFNLKQALDAEGVPETEIRFVTEGVRLDLHPDPPPPDDAPPLWQTEARAVHDRRRREQATGTAHDHRYWLDQLLKNDDYDNDLIRSIAVPGTALVHTHTTIEAAHLVKAMHRRPDRPLVALTSHCPEAPSLEWSEKFRIAGADPQAVDLYRRSYQAVDEFAFANADCLIFPCREAMEPYYQTMSEFDRIIRDKPLFFLPTGTPVRPLRHGRAAIRARFGIPEDVFVIGYIGRHNAIKGYDILSRVAADVLERQPRARILCAGQPGPLTAPVHPRWIEAGWFDSPADLIDAFDVFVLPNRQTYFDLVGLEVLSVGPPLLASDTGGNRYLAKVSPGVKLFGTEAELRDLLLDMAARPAGQLAGLRLANRQSFADNFALPGFARAYRRLVGDIVADLRVG